MMKILQDFTLMLLLKELKVCLLFLLLIILIKIYKNLKETAIKKYFVQRVNITKHNLLIDDRNFYYQPICDQIKLNDEINDGIRKIATGQGDDYTTGCLLDYQYFSDYYQLIAVDLSKQKELDADPRAIQQIEFHGKLNTKSHVCTILEKSKESVLEC